MVASAILLVDVDVAYDRPAALKLARRHPYGLALLEYKMQGMDGVELHGHLSRVHADTVGVLAGTGRSRAAGLMGIRNGRGES